MSNIDDKDAKIDLESKLQEFYNDFEPFLRERLQRLYSSGVGVLDDHKEKDLNWITPRMVFAAIAQEFADQVQWKDKKTDKLVKNYRTFL